MGWFALGLCAALMAQSSPQRPSAQTGGQDAYSEQLRQMSGDSQSSAVAPISQIGTQQYEARLRQASTSQAAQTSSSASDDAYRIHLCEMAGGQNCKDDKGSNKQSAISNRQKQTQEPDSNKQQAISNKQEQDGNQQSVSNEPEPATASTSEPAALSAVEGSAAGALSNQPHPEPATASTSEHVQGMKDVSLNANKPKAESRKPTASVPQPSVAPPGPAASSQQPAACADDYCRELRRLASSSAQPASPMIVREQSSNTTTMRNFVKNVAFDQLHIWTSPFKLRDGDATWAVPFGIVTGSLITTDHDVSKQLATPSRQDISNKLSNAGLYGSIAAGAGFYGFGLMTQDEHKREAGMLSGEAFVDATLVAQALKLAVGRQRPFQADHFGHIGKGGSSFPSEHAIGSFAIASVLAHEFPNPFMEIGAYGVASAVAASRVTAGQHFPSDVLVGSAFGYLIGRSIYREHHNPDLDGASSYGTFVNERSHDAAHSGSAYVELESWVYPAVDRLAAMGIISSNFDSERPWTRLECARLTNEAAENVENSPSAAEARPIVEALEKEFQPENEVIAGNSENRSAQLESIYTRVTDIAGPVLRDGYHFGQTIYNDYGRPYARGFNNITGFSARATSGPLVLYFRGEYQHAPANPAYNSALQTHLSFFDLGSPEIARPFGSVNGFQVLDAYLGVNFGGYQLTLGQQSLWWGPGDAGPFLLSSNAEPLKMVRLNRTSPVDLPGPLSLLGPMRFDSFLGQISGPYFIFHGSGTDINNILLNGSYDGPNLTTGPFIQGQRVTFKPTSNFELGLTHLSTFGGQGFALTTRSFLNATFSPTNTLAGLDNKPGDRRSGFDLSYRLPGIRDWATFYVEEFSEDEVSPLFIPRRSAMHAGIYLPKLPKVPKMDLRMEGIYTDIPSFGNKGFFYFNGTWRSGFTEDGNIMGSWIGREGRGVYATSTWWLSARNSLQLGYREATVDREFIEGGRYVDGFTRANFELSSHLSLAGMLQYEHWKFPALTGAFPNLSYVPNNNFTSQVQLTYTPFAKP